MQLHLYNNDNDLVKWYSEFKLIPNSFKIRRLEKINKLRLFSFISTKRTYPIPLNIFKQINLSFSDLEERPEKPCENTGRYDTSTWRQLEIN